GQPDSLPSLEQRLNVGTPAPLLLSRASGGRSLPGKPCEHRGALVLDHLDRTPDLAHVNTLYILATRLSVTGTCQSPRGAGRAMLDSGSNRKKESSHECPTANCGHAR